MQVYLAAKDATGLPAAGDASWSNATAGYNSGTGAFKSAYAVGQAGTTRYFYTKVVDAAGNVGIYDLGSYTTAAGASIANTAATFVGDYQLISGFPSYTVADDQGAVRVGASAELVVTFRSYYSKAFSAGAGSTIGLSFEYMISNTGSANNKGDYIGMYFNTGDELQMRCNYQTQTGTSLGYPTGSGAGSIAQGASILSNSAFGTQWRKVTIAVSMTSATAGTATLSIDSVPATTTYAATQSFNFFSAPSSFNFQFRLQDQPQSGGPAYRWIRNVYMTGSGSPSLLADASNNVYLNATANFKAGTGAVTGVTLTSTPASYSTSLTIPASNPNSVNMVFNKELSPSSNFSVEWKHVSGGLIVGIYKVTGTAVDTSATGTWYQIKNWQTDYNSWWEHRNNGAFSSGVINSASSNKTTNTVFKLQWTAATNTMTYYWKGAAVNAASSVSLPGTGWYFVIYMNDTVTSNALSSVVFA